MWFDGLHHDPTVITAHYALHNDVIRKLMAMMVMMVGPVVVNILYYTLGAAEQSDWSILDRFGRLALTLTQKRQCQVELWQNRTVQGFRPLQRSNCCQSWTIRIAKKT